MTSSRSLIIRTGSVMGTSLSQPMWPSGLCSYSQTHVGGEVGHWAKKVNDEWPAALLICSVEESVCS